MLYIFFNRLIFISIWTALDLGASEMRAMCFGPSQRISRLYTRYAGEWRSEEQASISARMLQISRSTLVYLKAERVRTFLGRPWFIGSGDELERSVLRPNVF